jgi:hypothetical protein
MAYRNAQIKKNGMERGQRGTESVRLFDYIPSSFGVVAKFAARCLKFVDFGQNLTVLSVC